MYNLLVISLNSPSLTFALPFRQALEAKAALYERLCRGEGLREVEEEGEEEGEGRYMVDFTRKVANEVSVVHC